MIHTIILEAVQRSALVAASADVLDLEQASVREAVNCTRWLGIIIAESYDYPNWAVK